MHTNNPTLVPLGRTVNYVDLDLSFGLSETLIATIHHACDQIEGEGCEGVLTIHLKGNGCADITTNPGDPVEVHRVNAWNRALRRIERVEATTISVVEESVNSLGLAVLLTTDFRVACVGVEFGLNYSGGGIMPDMTLFRLVNQAGTAATRQLCLFSSKISAVEAEQLRLIDKISENTAACVERFLRERDVMDAANHCVRRRLISEACTASYEDAIGRHLAASDRFLRNIKP
ncbi:enoyl-CoA-hydratase DpgB [Collimonas fungivorans]|nr:enoyl-CoA-hydratase DpgB [Collimonas fungivorans]